MTAGAAVVSAVAGSSLASAMMTVGAAIDNKLVRFLDDGGYGCRLHDNGGPVRCFHDNAGLGRCFYANSGLGRRLQGHWQLGRHPCQVEERCLQLFFDSAQRIYGESTKEGQEGGEGRNDQLRAQEVAGMKFRLWGGLTGGSAGVASLGTVFLQPQCCPMSPLLLSALCPYAHIDEFEGFHVKSGHVDLKSVQFGSQRSPLNAKVVEYGNLERAAQVT